MSLQNGGFGLPYLPSQYKTVQKGDRGDDVRKLQDELTKLGYNTFGIDGVFGNNTLNAVIEFQKANDLTPNGVFDSTSWNLMLLQEPVANKKVVNTSTSSFIPNTVTSISNEPSKIMSVLKSKNTMIIGATTAIAALAYFFMTKNKKTSTSMKGLAKNPMPSCSVYNTLKSIDDYATKKNDKRLKESVRDSLFDNNQPVLLLKAITILDHAKKNCDSTSFNNLAKHLSKQTGYSVNEMKERL